MSEVTVIGGVIGEIVGNPYGQLISADNNPGTISVSYSGTARNIAENLGRLGADVALASTVGNDFVGRGAKLELADVSVNTDMIRLLDGQNTAMNITLLNIVGDLEMAVNNADIFECLDAKMIDEIAAQLNESKIVGLDGTFSKETLEHITKKIQAPLFFDPATDADAEKAKDIIGLFHTIKPNRSEAAAISGLEIFSEDQLMVAGKWFADQGVSRIFITLSGGGVYYKEGMTEGILRPEAMLSKVNESGAGAAFSAAILDGFAKGMTVEEISKYGMAAAAVSLEAASAVNPNIKERMCEQNG